MPASRAAAGSGRPARPPSGLKRPETLTVPACPQVSGWRSTSHADACIAAIPEVKKPIALPFLKPLVAPASVSRCNYLLGSEATTPYKVEYTSTSRVSYSAPSSQSPPFALKTSKLAADKDALTAHIDRWTRAPTEVARLRGTSTEYKRSHGGPFVPAGTVMDAKYRPGHHGIWH